MNFDVMMCALVRLWNGFCAIRFLVVGAWNFIFGYVVFAGLYWAFAPALDDWMVVVIANVIGITNSFVTHRWMTYRSRGAWWKEYIRFYVVYGAQALINVGLIAVFVTWLGSNAYISQLTITLALTVVSYWVHKSYSFSINN